MIIYLFFKYEILLFNSSYILKSQYNKKFMFDDNNSDKDNFYNLL